MWPAGFYEDTGAMPSSSSSSPSSSSSLQLPVYTYAPHQMPDSSPTSAGDDESDDHVFAGSTATTSGMAAPIEKEHMFDKVVTPSDVGKLNRLVIPKQYAEKYFPLDSSTNEKGLLLNFEDRTGKPWRFRYSYWNSSQSYVMTKGWSRFVKDKKLDAGDVVSFQRGVGESGRNRLFIDWRRRPHMAELPPPHIPTLSVPHQFSFHRTAVHPWNPLFLQQPNGAASAHHQYLQHHYPYASFYNGNPYPSSPAPIGYPRSGFSGTQQAGGELRHAHGGVGHMVFDSVPVVQGKATAKRLRLFGVNMDCPTPADERDENPSIPVVQHYLTPARFESPPSPPHPDPEHRPYNQSDEKGKGSMSLDLDI